MVGAYHELGWIKPRVYHPCRGRGVPDLLDPLIPLAAAHRKVEPALPALRLRLALSDLFGSLRLLLQGVVEVCRGPPLVPTPNPGGRILHRDALHARGGDAVVLAGDHADLGAVSAADGTAVASVRQRLGLGQGGAQSITECVPRAAGTPPSSPPPLNQRPRDPMQAFRGIG